ncbi:MAG: hypothetical protein E7170_04430 [Firmicutes bacterium]|nr:hypothetical protein [Bacillota bacterium]
MGDRNGSKGNVEIEGVNVPEDNIIFNLLKKYENKLGKDTVDSFLYTLNECVKFEKGELDENINESRKSFRK